MRLRDHSEKFSLRVGFKGLQPVRQFSFDERIRTGISSTVKEMIRVSAGRNCEESTPDHPQSSQRAEREWTWHLGRDNWRPRLENCLSWTEMTGIIQIIVLQCIVIDAGQVFFFFFKSLT